MSDPNFPPNLDIHPLLVNGEHEDLHGQANAIVQYGIAGRVWEATEPLLEYLSPSSRLDPPCSLLLPSPRLPLRVIELGSGQAIASLDLASRLTPRDTVVLTDLPAVVPLCEQSIAQWERMGEGKDTQHANVVAQPMAWGEDIRHLAPLGPFTHILMCDLVYFPNLYPPLLRTLLDLTEPEKGDPLPESDTFGPEIILAYKSRTLSLEESFFDSLGRYFHMQPVTGADWEARIFICRRWRITEDWSMPPLERVMAGASGVVQGRSFGLVDDLFASLEWD